ncbi:uncharacterized protein K452DRAFT_287519 [Aplosporella prunicola CBS 121167]|uniref:F-box domain-containing protein n=1 Tax=Aplosporella prunicola CBS 121167 TaxID=1176127 RepID=A0A6A6BBY7_9PEZI|nr:uncharacterized protein K452DRAFT_287519 [Aplosporella prunicola CBS 121167]KAF2141556.1 hypothetical protein K452DRAFT_287519 [Aplosporella prunicola CBS 121167]
MASITTSFRQNTIAYVDLKQPVQPQLVNEHRDAEYLKLDNVNEDADWGLVNDHFKSVKELYMDGGWDEELHDDKVPPHWPLEKITLSGACDLKACRSRWITKGLVKHLVLYYPCHLLVENLKLAELDKDEHILPEKYHGKMIKWTAAEEDPRFDWEQHMPYKPKLEILEISENDARDTIFIWASSSPHLLRRLRTLSLIAWNGCDLWYTPGEGLELVLPHLTNLETLVIGLDDIYKDAKQLAQIFDALPPNIHTLRFRGSRSLARDDADHYQKWINKFDDPAFLPKLKTLSFILDLEDRHAHEGRDIEQIEGPPVTTAEAKRATERFCQAAERRGVKVEPFFGSWTESFTLALDRTPIDPEWNSA